MGQNLLFGWMVRKWTSTTLVVSQNLCFFRYILYEWRDAHPAITSSFFMWTVRALIHRCHRCQSLTGNDRHSAQRGGKRRWYTMGGLKASEHKCPNHISAQLLKGFHGKNGMESQENWIGCRVNGFTHCQNVSRNSLVILFRENLKLWWQKHHGFMYKCSLPFCWLHPMNNPPVIKHG